MSWAATFNPESQMANNLSGAMENIKLDSTVSEAEIQARINEHAQKSGDSFKTSSPGAENTLTTYTTSAPVINQNAGYEQYAGYPPVTNPITEGQIQTAQTAALQQPAQTAQAAPLQYQTAQPQGVQYQTQIQYPAQQVQAPQGQAQPAQMPQPAAQTQYPAQSTGQITQQYYPAPQYYQTSQYVTPSVQQYQAYQAPMQYAQAQTV